VANAIVGQILAHRRANFLGENMNGGSAFYQPSKN
jgi:hypothetical protein